MPRKTRQKKTHRQRITRLLRRLEKELGIKEKLRYRIIEKKKNPVSLSRDGRTVYISRKAVETLSDNELLYLLSDVLSGKATKPGSMVYDERLEQKIRRKLGLKPPGFDPNISRVHGVAEKLFPLGIGVLKKVAGYVVYAVDPFRLFAIVMPSTTRALDHLFPSFRQATWKKVSLRNLRLVLDKPPREALEIASTDGPTRRRLVEKFIRLAREHQGLVPLSKLDKKTLKAVRSMTCLAVKSGRNMYCLYPALLLEILDRAVKKGYRITTVYAPVDKTRGECLPLIIRFNAGFALVAAPCTPSCIGLCYEKHPVKNTLHA